MSHRPAAGSRRAPAPLIVELAANAPRAVLAAAEAAVRALAPRTAVELVRVGPRPRGEQMRIRGPLVEWDVPLSAGRRRVGRAMLAFAEAFDAALAVVGDGGDRA